MKIRGGEFSIGTTGNFQPELTPKSPGFPPPAPTDTKPSAYPLTASDFAKSLQDQGGALTYRYRRGDFLPLEPMRGGYEGERRTEGFNFSISKVPFISIKTRT
jgi:hypothetical protein